MARAATVSSSLAGDRARALALTPVSRETTARLDQLVELLLGWQRTTNLIAPATIPRLWTRHVADSLQLIDLAPSARVWVDVGSGAGFPGLVIACALAGQPGADVHLFESNTKKAAFLREAQRLTGAPATVHAGRFEDLAAGRLPTGVEVVCARAMAPLKLLCALCFPLLGKSAATGLFPKGQNAQLELDAARESWTMNVTLVPSRTDPKARIVVIRDLERGRITP
jgi:16S rRNA (guanine527-N7)-methyltransferase